MKAPGQEVIDALADLRGCWFAFYQPGVGMRVWPLIGRHHARGLA